MLVLDRKRGQQVTIGRNVVITVLAFNPDDLVRLQVKCESDLDVRHGRADDLDRLERLHGSVCRGRAVDRRTYNVDLRRGEVLAIGEFLVCVVRFLRAGVVRLGFEGPRNVPVCRIVVGVRWPLDGRRLPRMPTARLSLTKDNACRDATGTCIPGGRFRSKGRP